MKLIAGVCLLSFALSRFGQHLFSLSQCCLMNVASIKAGIKPTQNFQNFCELDLVSLTVRFGSDYVLLVNLVFQALDLLVELGCHALDMLLQEVVLFWEFVLGVDLSGILSSALVAEDQQPALVDFFLFPR